MTREDGDKALRLSMELFLVRLLPFLEDQVDSRDGVGGRVVGNEAMQLHAQGTALLGSLESMRVVESAQPEAPRQEPTHRCKVCGALWRLWWPGEAVLGDLGSWSLVSKACGECCDNVAMGDQIEALDPKPRHSFVACPNDPDPCSADCLNHGEDACHQVLDWDKPNRRVCMEPADAHIPRAAEPEHHENCVASRVTGARCTCNYGTRAPFVAEPEERTDCHLCADGNKPMEGPNGYVWHEYPGEDSERCTAQPIRDERDALRVAIAGRAYMGRSNADWVAIAERMRAKETRIVALAAPSAPEPVEGEAR